MEPDPNEITIEGIQDAANEYSEYVDQAEKEEGTRQAIEHKKKIKL